jgi:tetratricopeptide (TPR) repeat protein
MWGKAGDQALRRSAFQEAISHLGKAIAMADKAAGGNAGERRHLHVAYGNALVATSGYAAPETTEAFARVRESAFGDKDAPERLASDWRLWVSSLARGELPAMRAHAETFLSDVQARPSSLEAGIAHRVLGFTHLFAGEFAEARNHLERALALFEPGRDDDLAFYFGKDASVAAMLYLAVTLWPLGDTERSVFLVGAAEARIAGLTHIFTRAYAKLYTAVFELMRGDISRAAPNAAELDRLSGEHELPFLRAFAVLLEGLVSAESGAPCGGLDEMRHGAELLREQNILVADGLIKSALAEAEARAGNVDRALALLDEALATSERIGHRTFDAELYRIRGEMLLKRDPTNPVPAEEALQTGHCGRDTAGDAQLRTPGRAFSRQALSVGRPPCRSPRRPRARARELRTDARVSGDWGGDIIYGRHRGPPTFVTPASTMPIRMAGIPELRCLPSRSAMFALRRLHPAASRKLPVVRRRLAERVMSTRCGPSGSTL